MKKIIMRTATTLMMCMTMAFVSGGIATHVSASVNCSEEGKEAGKAKFDPAGTYHAYFEFQQSDSWIFRNAWIDPTLGLNGKKFQKGQSYDKILRSCAGTENYVKGTIKDAIIDGNGTYTVKVEGMDVAQLLPDVDKVMMLGVSTDIPSSAVDGGKIKISNVSWGIDGKNLGTVKPYVNEDAKQWGIYQMEIVNRYQSAGYTNPTMYIPLKGDIFITFKVSGMSKDSKTAKEKASREGIKHSKNASDSGSKDNNNRTKTIAIVVVVVVVAGIGIAVTKKKK